MSYDLHLVPSRPGTDALNAARALLAQDEKEINPGLPVPDKEAKKQRLATALIEANPQLAVFEFGYAAIAAQKGLTEEDARMRYRHLELNGPEDGNGIQVTLYDDTIDIAVPYWHQPGAAESVFEEIWRYLELLERDGGFAIYDPQLDRMLNLAVDRLAVLERYGTVVAQMPQITAHQTAAHIGPRSKPWWKFW